MKKFYYIDNKNYPTYIATKRRIHSEQMRMWLGRDLKKDEVVHQKDGNKMNWRKDNLELMTRSAHSRLHYIQDMLTTAYGVSPLFLLF